MLLGIASGGRGNQGLAKRWLLSAVLGIFFCALSGCQRNNIPDNVLAGRGDFVLYVDPSSLQDADTVALATLIEEADRLLPRKMKQVIGRPIAVAIDAEVPREEIHIPECEPPANSVSAQSKVRPQTLGRMVVAQRIDQPHLLLIHPGVIEIARRGRAASPRFSCGHKSLYDLALSTVLHEVMHAYDAVAKLSRNPVFVHMQQFAPQDALRRLKPHNQLRIRTPDVYEFHDIVENLAVNFEYFLLDPEFQCRRPAVYSFLAEQLQHQPSSNKSCDVNTLVYAGNTPVFLDPSRVYQIHYLFAARGKGIASRWGHSMFRVVMCSQARTQKDERCLEDLHDHIVLSFVANLRDDLTINSWKGLTGKYVAQVMIRPLTEVLNDYAEVDHRDLQSLPLALSDAEMRQFMLHTLELYWGYSGRYYFVTNNCADESLRLVQSVLPSPSVQKIEIMTPLGLRDELIKTTVADNSVLADRATALARGHLFASALDRYEALYKKIRPRLPRAAPNTFERYMHSTKARARHEWAQAMQHEPQALSGMFAIEGLILQRHLKEVERRIVIRILFRRDARYAELAQRLKTYLLSLRQPWELVQGGYGVPLPHEFKLEARQVRPGFPEEIVSSAMSFIKNDYPDLYLEYGQTEQNRKFLLSMILKMTQAPPSKLQFEGAGHADPARR